MADSDTDKTTLLVVDDSRLMRVAARKILMNDFNILQAADGEDAWEILQQHPEVSLVMSDLSMPNLDGLGLLKRIRESRLRELPVIIVTGAEDDDGSKQSALAAGASDFITKPFESVQLLARAKSQVRQKNTREALQQSETEKQQLREISQVDPLTGLANRRAFISHLEENLAYATRHRSELSLIVVRIDKYKVLFLRRGKQVAEKLARKLADVLIEGRRREDTVGLIALDTFGVLLPSASQPGAKRVLAQLNEAIEQLEVDADGVPVPFNVHFGVCTPEIRSGIRADEVMAAAEGALSSPAPVARPAVTPDAPPPRQIKTVVSTPPPPRIAPSHNRPAPARAREVASPESIHNALDSLARNTTPATTPDALARGVLPILDAWNRSHEQRYDNLVKALRAALGDSEKPAATETHSRRPTELMD